MIQRKQTIFLFLALICFVVCLCMPIAVITHQELGMQSEIMYNYGIIAHGKGLDFSTVPLAIILAIDCFLTCWSIFDFKKRKRQVRTCTFIMLLTVVYYICFGIFLFTSKSENSMASMAWAAFMPLVGLVLTWLARRGILADEALIKAADRIR